MVAQKSSARERVLDMAEKLFTAHGYAGVSMSDLASALEMQKASLYHHASAGKEALFVEVMARMLKRYQQGLESAIAASEPTFATQLRSAAYWLLANPSLHYERMMQGDMPKLSAENAGHLTRATYLALLRPLETVFAPEMQKRSLDTKKVTHLAGAFLAIVESVHNLPENFGGEPKTAMIDFLIETLFLPLGLR